MRLYHVQFDGESYYVEARDLPAAVVVWKLHVQVLWGDDFQGEEEPESIQLVHEAEVLRAREGRGSPKIVCLCGSTRFYKQFQESNYQETMKGHIVLSVGFYPHSQEEAHGGQVGITSEQKEDLDKLHKRKIELADEILVLNVNGYVGESTRSEIVHATNLGRKVRYLESEMMNRIEEGKA